MKRKHLLNLTAITLAGLFAQPIIAQSGYTLTGHVQDIHEPYIYLRTEAANSTHVDSAAVKDGHFEFKGLVREPQLAAITDQSSQKGFLFYLENSAIGIEGSFNEPQKIKISGSKTQDEKLAFEKMNAGVKAKQMALQQAYQAAAANFDSSKVRLINNEFDSLNKVSLSLAQTFVKAHPASVVSLALLSQYRYVLAYPQLDSAYNSLAQSVKNTEAGKKFNTDLAILERRQNGKPAMDFTQNDVNGQPVSLSDFKGKYVLLDFWASWCGPCRAENPNVLKVYNKYKDKNFTVLGVSLDKNKEQWLEAIKKDSLPWTQISDLQYWNNAAVIQYGIQGIPANFLIDPNGIIIGQNLRGEALEEKLAEVIK